MSKTLVIPSNPADIKAISDAAREWSNCAVQIDAEKDQQKAIVDMVVEKFELPKGTVSKLFKDYHNSSFDKHSQEFEDYSELYDKVFRTKQANTP